MPALKHIEVEPCLVVKPERRRMLPLGMVGHQMALVLLLDAFGHRIPYCLVPAASAPVASDNPYHVGHIGIPLSQHAPVPPRLRLVKQFRALPPLLVHLVAPRGQQSDKQPVAHSLLQHPVDMFQISGIQPDAVPVGKGRNPYGQFPVRAAQLRKNHGLNHRKALRFPVFHIERHFFPRQPRQQFPCRVSQIEERSSVLIL